MSQEQHAGDKREPAAAGDDEGHTCALAGRREMRSNSRSAENDVRLVSSQNTMQQQDVVAEDNADHRPLEQQEVEVEQSHGSLWRLR